MSQPTVLLVDDEPGIRESLRRLLRRAGWHATTASNAAEAVVALSRTRPDAAILDMRMPGEKGGMASGLDFLAFLRTLPECETLPVILLTGYFLTEEEDASARKHGATVLYKPADLHTIAGHLAALREASRRGPKGTA